MGTRIASRAEVLAARTPTTADAVAIQGREREKVGELRTAGLTYAQIIGDASEALVAAPIDAVEGIAAAEPVQAIELGEPLFPRLVTLGVADAIATYTAEQDSTAGQAWSDALTSTIGTATRTWGPARSSTAPTAPATTLLWPTK